MRKMLTFIAMFAVSLLVSGAARAGGTVWVVDDGADCANPDFATIQGAVDAAAPGDTILVCAGTYHERVKIEKNDLTLRAKGAPEDVIVDADGIGNGMWINNASGVTIEGFMVREGHDNDIFLTNASGNTVRKNVLTAAVHDGIELVNSDGNLIEHNLSFDNLAVNACGINLTGDSDGNVVRHNTARNNEWGIQVAGSATASSDNNVIFHNEVIGNRGNGIRNIGGASGNTYEGNRIFDNGNSPGVATGTTNAGLRLGSGTGLVVVRNHAFGNAAVDIRQDAAATATFDNNHCNTSSPSGRCEHDEGKGH